MLKSQQYNKDYLYPEEWNDDAIFRFDFLVAESKRLYPKIDEWLIKLAVHYEVNKEFGLLVELTEEEKEELNKNYSRNDGLVEYNIREDMKPEENCQENIILVNS